jgi:hypothetical protein
MCGNRASERIKPVGSRMGNVLFMYACTKKNTKDWRRVETTRKTDFLVT